MLPQMENPAIGLDEDDDFGEFGGFEAAEPVLTQESSAPVIQGLEASPSPWAVLTTDISMAPPDLVQAQVSGTGQQIPLSSDKGSVAPDGSSQGNMSSSQLSAAVQIPVTISNSSQSCFGPMSNEANSATGVTVAYQDIPNVTSVVSSSEGDMSVRMVSDNGALKEHVKVLTEQKQGLEKEFSDLLKQSKDLEASVKDLQDQLSSQKSKYDTLQTKHTEDLAAVKKAGHDSLAIIVEEYKELCKVSMLQQQELCERKLSEVLKKKSEECESLLKEQSDKVQSVLEDERKKMENILEERIKEEQRKSQVLLEDCIKEELTKNEKLMEKAVDKERELSKTKLEEAVKVERENSTQHLKSLQEKYEDLLKEEREKCEKAIEAAIKEEQAKSADLLRQAVEDERKRCGENLKTTSDRLKVDLEEYIDGRKQADVAVRQRSLTALDLFLDSARQQIQLLMNDNPSGNDSKLDV